MGLFSMPSSLRCLFVLYLTVLQGVASAAPAPDRLSSAHSHRMLTDSSGFITPPIVTITASGSSAQATLRRAISIANTNETSVEVILKADILLSSPLPALGFSAVLSIVGACGSRKQPRSCVIDGAGKHPILGGEFACGISLQHLVVQRALNGVHAGGCQFSARHVTFQHNTAAANASRPGGAVLNTRANSPTAGSPAQFTDCSFIANVALGGNGGAINVGRDPTGGPDLRLARCSFRQNKAAGSGGAVYAEGSVIYLRDSVLSQNVAGGGGGAIATTGQSFTAIHTRFSSNTATKGRGGAISIASSAASLLLCSSTFVRNKAPRFSSSNDINAGATDGNLTLCRNTGPARVRRTKALVVRNSCLGCTGCPGDCNGHGTCHVDSDLNPSCTCVHHYTPASACTQCATGYTLPSSCTACSPAFFPAKGACRACGGMDQISDLAYELGNILKVVTASSALQCQRACNATQAANRYPYCNLWAYVDASSPVSSCRRSCVMFGDYNDCGVGPVIHNSTFTVTYQFLEPSFNNCH